jgi:hypothetical protein
VSDVRRPAIVVLAALLVGALLSDPSPRDETNRAASATVLGAVVGPDDVGTSVWFCAGGTASQGGVADHRIEVVNTTDSPRSAVVTVAGSKAANGARPAPAARTLTVPPRGRAPLRLAEVVAAPYVAATVEIDGGGTFVEHVVTGPTGSDRQLCAAQASDHWYAPLSATATERNPTARAWLAIYNPFPDDAVVDVSFAADTGTAPPAVGAYVVPGRSVEVLDLTTLVPVAGQVSSAVVATTGRVVVDRIESFDEARVRRDLVITPAVPAAAAAWFFPSGRLQAGRSERLVVYNPSDERVEVAVDVRPDDPAVVVEPFAITIPARRHALLDLAAEERMKVAAPAGYSVVVRAVNGAVVAERLVVVAPGQPGAGAGSTTGSAFASSRVMVDGTAAGRADGSVLVVFNPNAQAIARVRLQVVTPEGRPEAQAEFELAPGTRRVVPFAQLGAGPMVVVVDATAPVVAERELVGEGGRSSAMGVPVADRAVVPNPVTLALGA